MEDKHALFDVAASAARRYLAQERDGAVGPDGSAIAALDAFSSVSLDAPVDPGVALGMLDTLGSAATMRTTGGRYFGFVNGGVTPVGLAASVIASAWDQNVGLPAMSPAASAIDAAAATMIVDALGLPASATAAFCAGATVANITAIVTARDALLERVGWDVHEQGLIGAPRISVVTSAEVHVSVLKGLRIAGFGQDAVTLVPTDAHGRMIADDMPETEGPTLVLLQAGNVNTGHSDPFREIIGRLDRSRSWVHVDGAFGLWANATTTRRASVDGVELADSWTTDAHKWLNAPYDCGVVICQDGAALRRSMRMDASYVPAAEDERALINLGLQMSQQARAVPVWAILASEGREGIAESIERCCVAAELFADRLAEAGVEILAPVAINQLLASFGDDTTTDAVIEAVQAAGTCWMGGTTWQGRRAMRISVSDVSTTTDDVEASVEAILNCWQPQRTDQ